MTEEKSPIKHPDNEIMLLANKLADEVLRLCKKLRKIKAMQKRFRKDFLN